MGNMMSSKLFEMLAFIRKEIGNKLFTFSFGSTTTGYIRAIDLYDDKLILLEGHGGYLFLVCVDTKTIVTFHIKNEVAKEKLILNIISKFMYRTRIDQEKFDPKNPVTPAIPQSGC